MVPAGQLLAVPARELLSTKDEASNDDERAPADDVVPALEARDAALLPEDATSTLDAPPVDEGATKELARDTPAEEPPISEDAVPDDGTDDDAIPDDAITNDEAPALEPAAPSEEELPMLPAAGPELVEERSGRWHRPSTHTLPVSQSSAAAHRAAGKRGPHAVANTVTNAAMATRIEPLSMRAKVFQPRTQQPYTPRARRGWMCGHGVPQNAASVRPTRHWRRTARRSGPPQVTAFQPS